MDEDELKQRRVAPLHQEAVELRKIMASSRMTAKRRAKRRAPNRKSQIPNRKSSEDEG